MCILHIRGRKPGPGLPCAFEFSNQQFQNFCEIISFDFLQIPRLNEDTVNLIFVTDNGANLVKGLRNDTHLRCACHCLNLAIEYGLSNSSEELTSIIDSCKKLVAHFKRAGLQKQLDGISLKQQVNTME